MQGNFGTNMMTPDRQLAERIVAELIGDGLLSAGKQESVCKKLSMGQMKADDWRRLMAETLRFKNPPSPGGASPWPPA